MEKNALKFIWGYLSRFKLFLAITFALMLIDTLSNRFSVYYMAELFDAVSSKHGEPNYKELILTLIVITLGLRLIKSIAFELSILFDAYQRPKINPIVVRDVFEHVNKHSIAFFGEEMSGNVSNKLGQLSSSTSQIISSAHQFFSILLTLVTTLGILTLVNLWFLPIITIWVAIMVKLAIFFGDERRARSKVFGKIRSETEGEVVDSIANYSEVKSFANYRFELRNLVKNLRKLRFAEMKDMFSHSKFHAVQHSIVYISTVSFAIFSYFLLINNHIDTVGFIFVNTMFPIISTTVFEISYVYNGIMRSLGTAQSALDTLAIEPEILDKPNACELKAKKAEIVFEKVSFAYKDKPDLFKNLNITINPGEKVGIVGSSGGGKSTFIKLIARYYDIQKGSIKINQADIKDVTQDSLHRLIATMPQDVCLFNRPLMENIRYGNVFAKDEEVIKAAKKANADEFIMSFPNGYQTKVGERGVVLSGGERQRIAIARAILKNSPILIFDEATSALDSESEKYIQKSLKALMKNKTVIAVAHRLSTLREMDRIIVFDKGKIVEEGTHQSLLRKKGRYYKLYNMQADGFMG